MAKSRYEYVKAFESDDKLLPDCWIVVRIDGRQFKSYVLGTKVLSHALCGCIVTFTITDCATTSYPSAVWIKYYYDGFTIPVWCRFTEAHNYNKPQDDRGIDLMNRCAMEVMKRCGDIVFAIGASDEYSFILRRDATLFSRRSAYVY